jgi:hypothetical protein
MEGDDARPRKIMKVMSKVKRRQLAERHEIVQCKGKDEQQKGATDGDAAKKGEMVRLAKEWQVWKRKTRRKASREAHRQRERERMRLARER